MSATGEVWSTWYLSEVVSSPLCLQDISGTGSPMAVQVKRASGVSAKDVVTAVGSSVISGGSAGGQEREELSS